MQHVSFILILKYSFHPTTDTVSVSSFHWKSGHVRLLVSVKSYQHMAVLSKRIFAAWELHSCQSVAIRCSKCCMTLISLTIHPCRFMRIVHQAGHTHLTIKYSTTVWFPHVQRRVIQVFGKFLWSCGRILMAVDAQWVMHAQIQLIPKESLRWSWRILNVITRPIDHHSVCFIMLPGSHSHITRKDSFSSLTRLIAWRMYILSQTGRHFNGFATQRHCREWTRSSHSNATIRYDLKA